LVSVLVITLTILNNRLQLLIRSLFDVDSFSL